MNDRNLPWSLYWVWLSIALWSITLRSLAFDRGCALLFHLTHLGAEEPQLTIHVQFVEHPVAMEGWAIQARLDGRVVQHDSVRQISSDELLIKLPLRFSGSLELKLAGLDAKGCIIASATNGQLSVRALDVRLSSQLQPLAEPLCE